MQEFGSQYGAGSKPFAVMGCVFYFYVIDVGSISDRMGAGRRINTLADDLQFFRFIAYLIYPLFLLFYRLQYSFCQGNGSTAGCVFLLRMVDLCKQYIILLMRGH